MTKEEFLKEMIWFVDFYRKTMNDTETAIWYEFFKDVPLKKFKEGLKKHLLESKSTFFPAPGEIAELVLPKWI